MPSLKKTEHMLQLWAWPQVTSITVSQLCFENTPGHNLSLHKSIVSKDFKPLTQRVTEHSKYGAEDQNGLPASHSPHQSDAQIDLSRATGRKARPFQGPVSFELYYTSQNQHTKRVVSQLWWKCSQLVYPFMLHVHFHMDHQHLIQSQRLPAITPRSFWDSSIIHLEGNRVSSTYEWHHFIYTFEQQTFTHTHIIIIVYIYNRSEWFQPLHRKTDNPGVSNQQVNISPVHSAGNARRKHFTHSMKHQLFVAFWFTAER